MTDILADRRAEFWAEPSAAAPEPGIFASPGWEKEIPIGCGGGLRIKMSLSQDKSSVYLVARSEEARAFVHKHVGALSRALRTARSDASGEASRDRRFRKDNPRGCYTLKSQWPEAIRWFRVQHAMFLEAATEIEAEA